MRGGHPAAGFPSEPSRCSPVSEPESNIDSSHRERRDLSASVCTLVPSTAPASACQMTSDVEPELLVPDEGPDPKGEAAVSQSLGRKTSTRTPLCRLELVAFPRQHTTLKFVTRTTGWCWCLDVFI